MSMMDGPRGADPALVETGAIAIIFAGGVGSRMGGADSAPKQFIEVAGKPILVWTVEHFQDHAQVESIYIASVADYIPDVQKLVDRFGLDKVRAVVAGGDSAQASILNGLRAAMNDGQSPDAVVLIHDGVRPLINAHLIDKNIHSVLKHGNAITSIPAFETVASAWEGSPIVDQVADRNKMHVLQAPQCFRLGEIYDLNRIAEDDGLLGRFVDQAHLMHHFGKRLHLVEGLRGNVKITVPLDVAFFTFLTSTGEHQRILRGEAG